MLAGMHHVEGAFHVMGAIKARRMARRDLGLGKFLGRDGQDIAGGRDGFAEAARRAGRHAAATAAASIATAATTKSPTPWLAIP